MFLSPDEAAAWLASLGVEQWPSPFPRAVVERDFECHTIWLATVAGEAIATASVLMNDPMFRGGTGGNAWYLYRFAVRRKAGGTDRYCRPWRLRRRRTVLST